MSPERQQRSPPRERTFAQLFPWRNMRRAVMLVLLILAIVMIKRSTGPLLSRVGEMWGPPPPIAIVSATAFARRRRRLQDSPGPGTRPPRARGGRPMIGAVFVGRPGEGKTARDE